MAGQLPPEVEKIVRALAQGNADLRAMGQSQAPTTQGQYTTPDNVQLLIEALQSLRR